jgi:hypothetical protein
MGLKEIESGQTETPAWTYRRHVQTSVVKKSVRDDLCSGASKILSSLSDSLGPEHLAGDRSAFELG